MGLTMRLSDAGVRCRQTKLIYPDHRPSPWRTEDATRDRSNRLLDCRATPAPKLTLGSKPSLPGVWRFAKISGAELRLTLNGAGSILRQRQGQCAEAAAPTRTSVRPCYLAALHRALTGESAARRSEGGLNRALPVNPRTTPALRSRSI